MVASFWDFTAAAAITSAAIKCLVLKLDLLMTNEKKKSRFKSIKTSLWINHGELSGGKWTIKIVAAVD